MKMKQTAFKITGLVLLSAAALPAESWTLPAGTTVKDNGPRSYRFTVEYSTGSTKGEVMSRQRLTGEYTRGLPGNEVIWNHATIEEAAGASGPYGAAKKQDFMEGLRYQNDFATTMKPGFFKDFPPQAVIDRNLIWDAGMIEMFGQTQFEHLQLNTPYSFLMNQTNAMPEVGTFENRNVVLEWVGKSERNGQPCALITYKAYFNSLDVNAGGVRLKGRSNYWGEIWVSLITRQIEYSTLYEDVLGELKLPGQDATQVINVFRAGTFVPIVQK
jgi:hypothetical protein